MRKYSVWQAIPMSFYSRKLYRDVAKNWGGTAFLYLFLIVALSMIPATYLLQVALNQVYVNVSDKFVAQIPVLTVKDGKISTPEKRPYIIKDNDNKEVIAVVDTTGKYKTLEASKGELLITETEVITKPSHNQTRIDQIPASTNLVFDPIVVNEYVKGTFGYAWIFIFPTLVVFMFLYRLIQAFIYAIFGRIFSAVLGADVSYGQALKITLVSITPVIVLLTFKWLYAVEVPYCGLWAFLLAMVYLFYGVSANKR